MKSRAGNNLISLSRSVNLSAGENEITFESRVPNCGYAVAYGNKLINATVAYEGKILNAWFRNYALRSNDLCEYLC